MMSMRVIIIGGVAGGMSAATRLRRLDETASITVLERSGHVSFANCGLPYYLGGVWERDGSYHQGPVWAWLLGHYALAEYRVHGDAAAAQVRLQPIRDHLLDAGLGTVSEILDGAPPHVPRGAPAQAWSVACVLEAWQRLERLKRQ